MNTGFLGPAVATVLTACGIETLGIILSLAYIFSFFVATVLTACGIETYGLGQNQVDVSCNSAYRLRY